MLAKFTSQATGSAKAPRGQGPATRPGHSSPELIRAESQGKACHRAGCTREMGLMLPHLPPPGNPEGFEFFISLRFYILNPGNLYSVHVLFFQVLQQATHLNSKPQTRSFLYQEHPLVPRGYFLEAALQVSAKDPRLSSPWVGSPHLPVTCPHPERALTRSIITSWSQACLYH